MPRCKYCGTEYTYDDRCNACGRLLETSVGITPYRRRVRNSVIISAILVAIGIAIAGIPIVGLVIVIVGVGALAYSLFGIEKPLWMIRNGARCRNSLAVMFLVLGTMTITFDAGCAILSSYRQLPPISPSAYLVTISIAIILMATGYFGRPSFLFSADPFEEIPKANRRVAGWTLIVSGVALQVVALTYGLLNPGAEYVPLLYSIITGIIFEIAGAGSFAPSGRYWVGEGGLE